MHIKICKKLITISYILGNDILVDYKSTYTLKILTTFNEKTCWIQIIIICGCGIAG